MKTHLLIGILVGFAVIAYAGPERMMESKEVMPAPAPDCCQWGGFYVGAHIGGQFGDSDDSFHVLDFSSGWSYTETGIVGGGQAGYNLQWHSLVFGPEFDIGYMKLEGGALSPIDSKFGNDLLAESSSDFYTTFRARIGFAHDCWLFYVTGGGIGVNYDTRITYIPSPTDDINGHKEDWDWGYTVGGGVERKIGCHGRSSSNTCISIWKTNRLKPRLVLAARMRSEFQPAPVFR